MDDKRSRLIYLAKRLLQQAVENNNISQLNKIRKAVSIGAIEFRQLEIDRFEFLRIKNGSSSKKLFDVWKALGKTQTKKTCTN